VRRFLGRALGWGVLAAEGAPHRAQRRVLNPAFGPAQVRELSGIFLDRSNEVRMPFQRLRVWLTSQQMRDLWLSKLDPSTSAARLNAISSLLRHDARHHRARRLRLRVQRALPPRGQP
jgi:hypothetical protein